MEYRVLGTLEVVRDGELLDLGAFRQRALLALLLTSPNSVFSTDQIIDGLWGDDVGSDRQNALWVHVSGLRTALEPAREKRSEGTVVLTRAPGYLISATPGEIDAVRFEQLVAEGRALVETDPPAASLVLQEALALWRGRAYEDFTYESFAQTEIARLEELRLEAVEARIDADLWRGLSRELVSELETLVRQHPLREWLTGQLMLALYRSGRQADAMRAYQSLRGRLGEDLGIDPSTRLRRLEEQIVTGDATLDVRPLTASSGDAARTGLGVRGYELRDKIGEGVSGSVYRAFQPAVGREVAIKVIRPELTDDPAFIRRFRDEAQLVARLEHPHIVPLYDYWREPGAAYLVMRLMKGGSLADVLDGNALDAMQVDRMIDQVGSALETAHRAGVSHGDIKPANILLDGDGNSYLSDFGIAIGDDGAGWGSSPAAASLGPPYASPEQLDRGDVTPSSDIYSLGVVATRALTGLDAGLGEMRRALPPAVVPVIERATDPDVGRRQREIGVFVAQFREALAGTADPTPDIGGHARVDNPYKGLRPFDGADAADFFGRERLVERLVARLGQSGTRGRFIAVVGPSGSGKSSVVKAGLLPAIRGGAIPMAGGWFTLVMTPAPHPFEGLESALRGVAVDPPPSLLEMLAGDNGLEKALRRVLPADGSQVLLVIDQFEELFTQVDGVTAQRFVDMLVSAVTGEQSRVRILATLRGDFYDRPLGHRGLGELLRDGTEIITPMTAAEVERAITGPVERYGITFEPALVAELVNDVVDRPGALPLLQYTLTELFDHRRGARITTDAYRDLGGISGALAKRAEGLLAELGETAHEVARQVFLRLVTLGEGVDDTRRRVLRTELEQLPVDRKRLDAVLDTFGRHRLLSFDRDPVSRSPTVEISHEALLTEWDRLREWIDGARQDVRSQRRLAEAMREWEAADRDPAYLLRGGHLEQLHGWAATSTVPLSGPEREFLDAAVAERDREVEGERQRQRRTADAELRAERRLRQLTAAAIVGLAVAALAVFGMIQWRSATDATARVESLVVVDELVSASRAALADDPELAVVLAVQAIRETVDLGFATEDAVDALHFALQRHGVQYDVDPDIAVAVRPGPDGSTGVFALPPSDLVRLAEDNVARVLTLADCESFYGGPCPGPVDVTASIGLRFGMEAYGAVPPGPGALAGTTVTLTASTLRDDRGFAAELAAFRRATGIEIHHIADGDADLLPVTTGSVEVPDVAAFSGPIPPWARSRSMAMDPIVAEETLRADYGDYLLGFVTVGPDGELPSSAGTIRGVPLRTELKGMVYYPKAAFDSARYQVPGSWDELLALSSRMVADGHTPWCFGFGSGFASGWPGTDLIESLVLRTAGVEAYDEWVSGTVGFADPAVAEAGRLADAVVFGDGFVRGGTHSISTENYDTQLFPMLERDPVTGDPAPDCWFLAQGSLMLEAAPAGTVIGEDLDFFMLPPVDPSTKPPVLGEATFATGLVDRPEVRALLRFMAGPEWGRAWASDLEAGTFIPANRRFDPAAYGDLSADTAAQLRSRLAAEVGKALDEGRFRYDASDLMPPVIGSWTEDFRLGAFWQGMLDWVDGNRTIGEVFAAIDAEWAALGGGTDDP